MTSILFEQKPKHNGQEPLISAVYSIVPGIGQLYNGKTIKGILFLTGSFLSSLVLYGSLNPSSTIDFAYFIQDIYNLTIGFILHTTLNTGNTAPNLLELIKYKTPFFYCLTFMIFCFVIYSMADAYIDAEKQIKIELKHGRYDDIKFSESITGSYIFHIIVLISLFVLSLYFVVPKKEKLQITEIEFIMPQIESKTPPPPDTKRASSVQSIDQGKHIKEKPITPVQKSNPLAPAPSKPAPKPTPKPMPIPVPQAPAKEPIDIIKPPEPEVTKSPPMAVPKVSTAPALHQATPKLAPISQTNSQQGFAFSAPKPILNIAPGVGVSDGDGTSVKILAVPRVPGKGGLGEEGNPFPNKNSGSVSISAQKDIDFGPYIQELQRRIKREWKPPRGNEAKSVIVGFKINKQGKLSELTIKKSSLFKPSDDAAILAIQSSSPFPPLPVGAPPEVDIEFTFDYKVFEGR